jgi:hypothetical protein
MAIYKKYTENNELNLYINGKLVYKKWLESGESKIFDVMAYDKYTLKSYMELHQEFDRNDLLLIKARVKLISTADGGRKGGIISGYRPNHVFEYNSEGRIEQTFVGDIVFEGSYLLEPGEERIVTVRFLPAQSIEKYLEKGKIWFIHEGAKRIGTAEII